MKMFYRREVCTPKFCIISCTPSPQSTKNILSLNSTNWPEGEVVFVGLALPQPNIVTLPLFI